MMGEKPSATVEISAIEAHEAAQHTALAEEAVLKPQNNGDRSFVSGWWIEIIGLVAAAGSLTGIVAILFKMNHKQPKDFPFKLELPTILSILAKVTETTIALVVATCLSQIMWMRYRSRPRPLSDFAVYDAATRGATGQAFFMLQRGHSYRGYIGVILALLTLVVAPFYQQTARYEVLNGSAALGRCFKSNHSRASAAMNNALHLALYTDINGVGTPRDSIFQQLNDNCSTGNCSWPIFPSLGVCGQCTNATEEVVEDCSWKLDQVLGTVYGCTYTLNNVTLVTNYTVPRVGRSLADMSENIYGSTLGKLYGNAVIYDFSSLRYSAGDILHAASCVLYSCVRGHNATVVKTVLTENVTATYASDAIFATGDYLELYQQDGYDTVLSPPKEDWGLLNMTEPMNFTMDWYTSGMMWQYLAAAFNGTHSVKYTNSSEASKYVVDAEGGSIVSQIYKNLAGASFANQNMNTVVANLAREMSYALRSTCSSADFAQGTMENVETLLDVAWLWFIFPAVLIVMTAMFLFATMLESYRRRAMLWKTGILPLLFHGVGVNKIVPDRAETEHGPAQEVYELSPQMAVELDRLKVMQKHATHMRVQLTREKSGRWQLSKND